mmetsp:Transcript_5052/g.12621  ORF Transcript_5052/g.12621 Transcript_5052/m.12621 type:complete len:277 (-) Transcript_5052:180-1010(-)
MVLHWIRPLMLPRSHVLDELESCVLLRLLPIIAMEFLRCLLGHSASALLLLFSFAPALLLLHLFLFLFSGLALGLGISAFAVSALAVSALGVFALAPLVLAILALALPALAGLADLDGAAPILLVVERQSLFELRRSLKLDESDASGFTLLVERHPETHDFAALSEVLLDHLLRRAPREASDASGEVVVPLALALVPLSFAFVALALIARHVHLEPAATVIVPVELECSRGAITRGERYEGETLATALVVFGKVQVLDLAALRKILPQHVLARGKG